MIKKQQEKHLEFKTRNTTQRTATAEGPHGVVIMPHARNKLHPCVWSMQLGRTESRPFGQPPAATTAPSRVQVRRDWPAGFSQQQKIHPEAPDAPAEERKPKVTFHPCEKALETRGESARADTMYGYGRGVLSEVPPLEEYRRVPNESNHRIIRNFLLGLREELREALKVETTPTSSC